MISRWDVIEVQGRATSTAAKLFLDTLERRLPFALPALQVDGAANSPPSSSRLVTSAA